jgi:hypothetical protein
MKCLHQNPPCHQQPSLNSGTISMPGTRPQPAIKGQRTALAGQQGGGNQGPPNCLISSRVAAQVESISLILLELDLKIGTGKQRL